jgi:hypothetical protein
MPYTDLRPILQQRAGLSTKAYSSRNAAYDLAKLKGKKLVHHVKGSRSYKADPTCAFGRERAPPRSVCRPMCQQMAGADLPLHSGSDGELGATITPPD